MQLKKLKLSNIRVDGGTQVRKELDQYKVQEYAELMKDGAEFPPIVVFFDGSDHWLSAGFTRYFAYKQNGVDSIDCDVRPGTKRDALRFAISSNKHGNPHKPEDNRNVVSIIIADKEWSKWSNRQIALEIGVSHMTISRIRKEFDIKPTEVTYETKDGKKITTPTKNLNNEKKIKEKKEQDHAPVYDENSEKIKELGDTLIQISEENTLLRDKIAIGQWDASEIEKIDIEETVANLREQVRILEIDNQALRESRDMFQNKYNEAVKMINSMKRKYKEA